MFSRHDLSDDHWDRIRHMLPGQSGGHGGVGDDTRGTRPTRPRGSGRHGLRRFRIGRRRRRTRSATPDASASGGSTDRDRRKKGAPIRLCPCGRAKTNRGPQARRLVSSVGVVTLTRRYWQCPCGADGGSYAADRLLGIDGRFSRTVQKHAGRLSADVAFAATRDHLREMLGVGVCAETIRTLVEGHGKALGLRLKARGARWNKANVRPMASLVGVRHSPQWDAYRATAA